MVASDVLVVKFEGRRVLQLALALVMVPHFAGRLLGGCQRLVLHLGSLFQTEAVLRMRGQHHKVRIFFVKTAS